MEDKPNIACLKDNQKERLLHLCSTSLAANTELFLYIQTIIDQWWEELQTDKKTSYIGAGNAWRQAEQRRSELNEFAQSLFPIKIDQLEQLMADLKVQGDYK